MKSQFLISLLVCLGFISSCTAQEGTDTSKQDEIQEDSVHYVDHYANEYGDVYVRKYGDSTYQTTWINNDGFEFKIDLYPADDNFCALMRPWSEHLFLKYNYGGIVIMGDELWVNEFSSFGKLGSETQIPHLYERKFFRMDKEVALKGHLTYSKGHALLEEIWFDPNPRMDEKYYQIKGRIRKEQFPNSFLSTDDSPQGLAGVDENSYRLVFDSYELLEPELTLYHGSIFYDKNGEPHLAWDFADSESFRLDNAQEWDKNAAGTSALIEGYLTQDNIEGSVLRNWKLLGQGEKITIVGTKSNLNGNGGITPENALVMGYELEGHGTWPEDEVNTELKVEGHLYTVGDKMVIKNYKFIY